MINVVLSAPKGNIARAQTGFTLLEVLIAIGITALIGLGAWQVLNSAITSSDRTQVHLEELNRIQKAMLIVKRDLSQLIGRSIRDEYGDFQSALVGKSDTYELQFSRVGWRNPMDDKRSEVQRVAYELDEGTLLRHYWTVLDQTHDSKMITKSMLKGVESLQFKFMNETEKWVSTWPEESDDENDQVDKLYDNNKMPKAIKFELMHKQFGEIVRIFQVSAYHPAKKIELKKQDENESSGGTVQGSGSGSATQAGASSLATGGSF